jgi:hypothetical protein
MCERLGSVIICGRRGRNSLGICRDCGVKKATRLCDGPSATARGKTCDKPLCEDCATPGGYDVDYCKEHWKPDSRKLSL